jgi:hypothetical protein
VERARRPRCEHERACCKSGVGYFLRTQGRNGCTIWGMYEAVGGIASVEENIGSCIQLQDLRVNHLATQDEAESLTIPSSPPPTVLEAAKPQLRGARRLSAQGHRPSRSQTATQNWHRHPTMSFLNRSELPPSRKSCWSHPRTGNHIRKHLGSLTRLTYLSDP